MSESGGMSFDADWSAPRSDSKDQWWNIALGNSANYGEAADAYVQELLKNNGVITPGMDALKAEGWRRGYFQEPKKGDFLSQYAPLIIGGLTMAGIGGLGTLGNGATSTGLGDWISNLFSGGNTSGLGLGGMDPVDFTNLQNGVSYSYTPSGLGGALDFSGGSLDGWGLNGMDPVDYTNLQNGVPSNYTPSGPLQSLKDYISQNPDSTAKALASALKSFSGATPQLQGYQVPGSSSPANAVNSSAGTQSTLLANPTAQQEQLTPMQSDQTHIGFIDPNPANNTFLQAGSTWNPRMAAALRNR